MNFQLLVPIVLFLGLRAQYNVPSTVGSNLPSEPVVTPYLITPSNSSSNSSFNTMVSQKNISALHKFAYAQRPLASFDDLFRKTPPKSYLVQMAEDGDTVGFARALKIIGNGQSQTCKNKIVSIYQLVSIVKSVQLRNLKQRSSIQQLLNKGQSKIAQLQSEIAEVTNERGELNLSLLQRRLKENEQLLTETSQQFSKMKINIRLQKQNITELQKQIQDLVNQGLQEKKRVSEDKLKLSTITQNKNISIIFINSQKKSIQKREATIKESDVKIANLRSAIQEANKKIVSQTEKANQVSASFNLIYMEIGKKKAELKLMETKDKRLMKRMDRLISQLNIENKVLLLEDNITKIQNLIDDLRKISRFSYIQINKFHQQCYGEQKIRWVIQGDQDFYVMKPEFFLKYVANIYGIELANDSMELNSTDIRLQVIQVGSEKWMGYFGFEKGSFSENIFSCRVLQDLSQTPVNGKGVVEDVRVDKIIVKSQTGQKTDLSIDACSRIESSSGLPHQGQQIVWKGSASKTKQNNLFLAICY